MAKAYLNCVEELWVDEYEKCSSIVNIILEIINDNLDYLYVPWCPMAYGPQIGLNDFKYTIDNLGNKIGVGGTGDNFLWVSPNMIRSSYINYGLPVEIRDLDLEEIKDLVTNYLNK